LGGPVVLRLVGRLNLEVPFFCFGIKFCFRFYQRGFNLIAASVPRLQSLRINSEVDAERFQLPGRINLNIRSRGVYLLFIRKLFISNELRLRPTRVVALS